MDAIKEKSKLEAIQKEILLIFQKLKAVEPVMKSDIPLFCILSGKVLS